MRRIPILAAGWAALLCAPVMAAGMNADCLSEAQRGQLFLRQGEAAAIAALEVGPRLRALREAQAAIDKAHEAWATCEADRPSTAPADACSKERDAFRAANEALPGAQASHKEALDELKAKTDARLKAVREEFPGCG